ncbi:DNA-methyltransferase [Metamycoplasma hominis]|uniref:DNA-methyltransferase n=1 Tax=Metamycoplasma hominis TaxID=2098 RepID=UPI0012AADB9D|nr:site-specific DNA-methyltransferase [Metamycoplasma hominis]
MNYKNKILVGETTLIMKELPEKTFDFCFADPPYFLQTNENKELYRVEGTKYQGTNDEWDKFDSIESYKKFTKRWLSEVMRLLKDNGTICVISGMQTIYEIGNILKELGFWIINDIIWQKSNPTPNFMGSRLNNSHETLIWAKKSKNSKYTFNYKTGKYLNNGKQMGSVWNFSVCSGNERLKDENGLKLHNTQKPESLLYRIITLFTKKGDLILDPFGGTMTTAAVAKKTGRNFTMIEKDEKYVKYGLARINNISAKIGVVENSFFDQKPIRVSMSEMISDGYFKLGEYFINSNGEKAKLAKENGWLEYQGATNSMHEVAAKMIGRERRVNAFNYLFVERDGELISINKIRENYRQHLITKSKE